MEGSASRMGMAVYITQRCWNGEIMIGEMGCRCGRQEIHVKLWWGIVLESGHFEDQKEDGN
jgi:hypothetical protein